jgi:glucose-1-phosphate cytidylyltransferase
VDVNAVIRFHQEQGRMATITATQPPGRFGALNIQEQQITSFREKPGGDGGWINGGYFVLSPRVLDYIDGDDTVWERGPLETLAAEGGLSAYLHRGFWQPMDTLRDKNHLEELWNSGKAPWKIWK